MKTPPGRRRPLGPRLALGALLAVVVLAAAHAALWRYMASQLEQGLATWTQVRRAQGWRVEHAPPLRGGWPFSATLSLATLRIQGGGATLPGGLVYTSEGVVLRVTLPRLDRLRVELHGPQRLRLGEAEFPFVADSLVAILPLEQDTPPREAEVLAERLRVGTPGGALEVRTGRLTVEGSSSATEAEPALALGVALEGVDLPAAPAGQAGLAFGRRVASLGADLALTGPVPPGRQPVTRAEAWRDGGGTLELRSFALRWGPVGAQAAATLALDDALQPMGAGTLRLAGAAEALDALAEAGLVGRRAAGTARAVLPLLSRPAADGTGPEVEVPFTLEDRTLAVARIPVTRLAPWTWPSPDLGR
ncbi:DUF2125 domain-containing protein [Falsiroseomonas sp. CW058]|uniref:DUF2125 domain-containing protein n=1 Tax=Falsiroseomonas sp. CW058 TaxID=3388664 RepID=UPI003D3229E4